MRDSRCHRASRTADHGSEPLGTGADCQSGVSQEAMGPSPAAAANHLRRQSESARCPLTEYQWAGTEAASELWNLLTRAAAIGVRSDTCWPAARAFSLSPYAANGATAAGDEWLGPNCVLPAGPVTYLYREWLRPRGFGRSGSGLSFTPQKGHSYGRAREQANGTECLRGVRQGRRRGSDAQHGRL